MRRLLTPLLVIALVAFIGAGITQAKETGDTLQLKEVQLKDTSADLKELKLKYDNLNFKLDQTDKTKTEEIKRLEAEKNQLEQERKRLEGELQAKLHRQQLEKNRQNQLAANAANALTGTATASAASIGNCGDNIYKQYIYQKESGCNTNALNSIGCYGIGQACPRSKIAHCGADFACQDAWFSNYAVQRYGSWAKAYEFWVANHWW